MGVMGVAVATVLSQALSGIYCLIYVNLNIPELKDVRFKAFNHYMNRESHNGPENISDYKEIDYNVFHEALKLVFEKAKFGEHYEKMRKVAVLKP